MPCEVELASEFRYRDPILTRNTLVIAISQSGETMDTLMAVRHAKDQRRPGPGDLQRQRLDASPASPTRSVHARRARGRRRVDQGVPHPGRRGASSSRSTSPRCAARSAATRSRPTCASSRRCRRRSTRCSTRWSRSARSRASLVDAKAVLFLGRHVGYPGGARGRAQAQGARVHARRGLRGRRAQARPDRADRGGPAGRRRRAVAARSQRPARQDRVATSRRSGPAVPAPSSSPRRATRRSCRTPTTLIRVPAVPTLLQPLVATVPLQVFACEMAAAKGYDVDQPRNLAKSVTVE